MQMFKNFRGGGTLQTADPSQINPELAIATSLNRYVSNSIHIFDLMDFYFLFLAVIC
jgi:hypothetical protein